jgi:hypothetical protein
MTTFMCYAIEDMMCDIQDRFHVVLFFCSTVLHFDENFLVDLTNQLRLSNIPQPLSICSLVLRPAMSNIACCSPHIDSFDTVACFLHFDRHFFLSRHAPNHSWDSDRCVNLLLIAILNWRIRLVFTQRVWH